MDFKSHSLELHHPAKMGSKKHKKHKSDKKDSTPETERAEKPLKLVLKVGGSNVQQPAAPAAFAGQQEKADPDRSADDGSAAGEVWSGYDKHKKPKKKKKKKSGEREKEKEKEKLDKKHKHHHHHHHKEHEKKDKRKRDFDASQDSLDGNEAEPGPPSRRARLDDGSPGCRPLRDPRTCTLRRRAEKTPLQQLLLYFLKSLQKRDPHQFFAWPVSDIIAPGYSSIISKPMDFSTMKKKIEAKDYANVNEFRRDLKLMCDNATTYNRPDTVYFKAAKKMWHVGQKLMSRDELVTLLSTLTYGPELTKEELSIDVGEDGEAKSVTEENSVELPVANPPESKKLKSKSAQQDVEISEDGMTPEEILAQVRKASKTAASKLTAKKPNSKLGFLRQHENGSTTLAILNPDSGAPGSQQAKVNLEMLVGKLSHGTGHLSGFKEDTRNITKPVSYINNGTFASYGPQHDTAFANLSKEESDLLYSTYGDELGFQYAESLLTFARDCNYMMSMVDNLLDILTGGEHSKTWKLVEERRKVAAPDKNQRTEGSKITKKQEQLKLPTILGAPVDLDAINGFNAIGLDVLDQDESNQGKSEAHDEIQRKLDKTSELLQDLAQVQMDRLCATPPPHLAHISRPSSAEQDLADKVTKHLGELTSQASPADVTSVEGIRKAMGITVHPVYSSDGYPRVSPRAAAKGSPAEDITEVTGDSQKDLEVISCSPVLAGDETLRTTELDSELQEFLETGPLLRVCDSPSVN